MKDFFMTIILTIVIILIIVGVGILGINIYNDLNIHEVGETVQNFVADVANTSTDDEQEINEISSTESPLTNIKSVDKIEEKNITYSNNTTKNNYFYGQLNEYSKLIYNGLLSNIENLKTGTYKIEFGNSFSNVLSQSNGQQLLGEYYQSAIEAFMYDNPRVFYINVNKMYLNIESTKYAKKTTYNVYISNGNEANYYADVFSSKEQINSCEKQIQKIKNQVFSSMPSDVYKKIKYIHNYLVDNLSYDSSVSKQNIYNIYGALVNNECVCEGYSKAFKYLLDEAGIQNVIVIGKGTNSEGKSENHSWNYVLVNNNWYAIDVTWDDPVIRGGGKLTDKSRYKYFLKGSNSFSKDHVSNGQFTANGKIFTYPTLSIEDYE